MAFDESQRGRGYFYSDKNRGTDATIESAYLRNRTGLNNSIDQTTIEQIVENFNNKIRELQNSLDLIAQKNSQLESQINTLIQENSQLTSQYQILVNKIEQWESGQDLPIASHTQLGVVKIGDGLEVEDGTLSTDSSIISFDDGPGGLDSSNVSGAIQELTGKIRNPYISEENEEELVL